MHIWILPIHWCDFVGSQLRNQVQLFAWWRRDNKPGGAVQFHQLGEDLSGRTGSEEEDVASRSRIENLDTVECTRRGLDHDGLARLEITDRKNPIGFNLQILGESTIQRHPVGSQVLTKEKIAAHAIKAGSADSVAIGNNPLARVKPRHIRADRDDLTRELMARDKWKPWSEFTLMNVKVRATQTTGMNAHERLVRRRFRVGGLPVGE